MNRIKSVALKEWRGFYYSPLGYIFAGLLMTVSAWLFFQDFFVAGVAELSGLWGTLAFLFSLFIPAISMNLLAEEKRNSTWEVLLSLPLRESELVLGKYLGSWLYLLSVMSMTVPAIITVIWLGQPEAGPLLGGLLGLIMLGSAYLATGIFGSSLTSQPITGFLISTLILLLNSFMGQEYFTNRLPAGLAEILGYLSLNWHSLKFSSGLISMGDVIFFLSWIGIFLILSILSLSSRDK